MPTASWSRCRRAASARSASKLDALLDEHRIRVVHPVAAERRIVRVDEHGQVLGARRSPKRATAVAVFDKLVAFPSLLTHPNLTIEVLLLREDHIRRPQPTTTRGRTRDPGERRLVEVLDRVALRTPEDILAALPALPLEPFSTRELAALSAAARCWRSARSTACGRSGSSSRRASAAAPRCTRARREPGHHRPLHAEGEACRVCQREADKVAKPSGPSRAGSNGNVEGSARPYSGAVPVFDRLTRPLARLDRPVNALNDGTVRRLDRHAAAQ